MARRSIEMYEYCQALMRMRQGDSEREIARAKLMGRAKAARFRELAAARGWLERASYGTALLDHLGQQLSHEFGRGFEARNLRRMVKFAQAFPDAEIVTTLSAKLSWSHLVASLLVYAAGFRGSARRLRSRAGCRLYLRAPASAASLPAIERWLFEPQDTRNGSLAVPVYFFGDLDHAGMQILASLREVFSQASAWRPGYVQLASLLAAGAGHPPELAAKAQQTDPGRTGCAYADDELLPLLRSQGRFIDQEAFELNNVDGQGR